MINGESRYCYSHGIPWRKTDCDPDGNIIKRQDRISVTLREIIKTECNCDWSNLCDSQDGILEKTRIK